MGSAPWPEFQMWCGSIFTCLIAMRETQEDLMRIDVIRCLLLSCWEYRISMNLSMASLTIRCKIEAVHLNACKNTQRKKHKHSMHARTWILDIFIDIIYLAVRRMGLYEETTGRIPWHFREWSFFEHWLPTPMCCILFRICLNDIVWILHQKKSCLKP